MTDEQTPKDPPNAPSGNGDVTPTIATPNSSTPSKGILVDFASRERSDGDGKSSQPVAHAPVPTETSTKPKHTNHELRHLREQRRRQAYTLWLQNIPLREIGRHLGVSAKTVWYDIEAYRLSEHRTHAVPLERRRDKLVEQHAINQRGLFELATNAPSATARVMARSELTKSFGEVAKLLGAHAPVKITSTNAEGTAWAPLVVTMLSERFSVEELRVLERAAKLKLLPQAEVIEHKD